MIDVLAKTEENQESCFMLFSWQKLDQQLYGDTELSNHAFPTFHPNS
jgi:hypothetical protein